MRLKKWALAALVAGAMGSAHALEPVLSEGFDDFSALAGSGWLFVNNSAAAANPWFAGNSGIFAAAEGDAGSYVAANYLSSGLDTGAISNWMITPEISLMGGETLSFFARTETADFFDGLNVWLSPTGSGSTGSFSVSLLSIAAAPAQWSQYSVLIPDLGGATSVRIAFEYAVGNALDANYLGIDSVAITPVPEPTTAILLGLGLAGLLIRRRVAA